MSEVINNKPPLGLLGWGAAALTVIVTAGGATIHYQPEVHALAQEVHYDLRDTLLPKDGCQRVDHDTLRDTVTTLHDGLRKPRHPEDYAKLDQIRDELRVKHGLTAQNTEAVAHRIDKAETGTQAMAILGEFTVAHFGFKTETPADADPKDFASDANSLITRLESTPNELIDAAGIDVVYLSDPEPATVKVDDGVANAFTNATPGTNETRKIHLGPKQTDSFEHEIGHQIQRRYAETRCSSRPLNNFPAFEATNPPNFKYQFPAKNWEGVTLREYGARRLEEDVPVTFEALLNPITERCYAVEQSRVLIEKVSIEVIMLNALKANLGTYYLENFIAYCNTIKPLN